MSNGNFDTYANAFGNMYIERLGIKDSINTQLWGIYPLGDGDLSISLDNNNDLSDGVAPTIFTLSSSGVIAKSTDLINKAYADANYSSSAGISPENQRKLDNARKFKKINHSSDFTFIADSILLSVNPDEGKKPRHIVSGSDDVVFTVPDIGILGEDTILVQNLGTGTVRVKPDTGETFIGNDTTRNFGGAFTEFTIPTFGTISLYKSAANQWFIDGNFTIVEPVFKEDTPVTSLRASPKEALLYFSSILSTFPFTISQDILNSAVSSL